MWKFLCILYASFIIFLSTLNRPPVPFPVFSGIDKLLHFWEYAIFAFLFFKSLNSMVSFIMKSGYVISFVTGFAAMDEFLQMMRPGRQSDVMDWMADVAGAFILLLILNFFEVKDAENSHMGL